MSMSMAEAYQFNLLRKQVDELTDRLEAAEAELKRRRGGRPKKIAEERQAA